MGSYEYEHFSLKMRVLYVKIPDLFSFTMHLVPFVLMSEFC